MDNVRGELELKCIELESAELHLSNLKKKYIIHPDPCNAKKQCGHCHLRTGHSKAKCSNDPCVSAVQCGDPDKHTNEKREITAAKDMVNKLQNEKKKVQATLDIKVQTLKSTKRNFPTRVQGALVNSNKSKYLVRLESGECVVRRAILNADLAVLEKYYKSKVPDDLKEASRCFAAIINNFNAKHKETKYENPIRKLLETDEKYAVQFPSTTDITTGESTKWHQPVPQGRWSPTPASSWGWDGGSGPGPSQLPSHTVTNFNEPSPGYLLTNYNMYTGPPPGGTLVTMQPTVPITCSVPEHAPPPMSEQYLSLVPDELIMNDRNDDFGNACSLPLKKRKT